MKKHANKHIRDLQGDDEMDDIHDDIHGGIRDDGNNDGNNGSDGTAGNLYGNFKKKEGEDPLSIVRNMANLIDIKIKLEELSDDKTYVIVEFNGEIFITTMR